MGSMVLRIQAMANDSSVSVSDLLRFALTAATKLKVTPIEDFLRSEMNGYGPYASIPHNHYRRLDGQPVGLTTLSPNWVPLNSLGNMQHISAGGEKILNSVAQLEYELRSGKEIIVLPWPEEKINAMRRNNIILTNAGVAYRSFQLYGILDFVRNQVLRWALGLEQQGISGDVDEGFTKQEVAKASSTVYNIDNLQGVAGSVSAEHIHIGDYYRINNILKQAGMPQSERNELENIVDEANQMPEEERKSLASRATAWMGRNKSFLLTAGIEVIKLLQELKIIT